MQKVRVTVTAKHEEKSLKPLMEALRKLAVTLRAIGYHDALVEVEHLKSASETKAAAEAEAKPAAKKPARKKAAPKKK